MIRQNWPAKLWLVRHGQSLANVAFPAADADDREHQRLVARRLRALHQLLAGAAVAPHVELEPAAGAGRGGAAGAAILNAELLVARGYLA